MVTPKTEPTTAIVCQEYSDMYYVSAFLRLLKVTHYAALPNESGDYSLENFGGTPKLVVTTLAHSEGHPYNRVGMFRWDPVNANNPKRINLKNYSELLDNDQVQAFVRPAKPAIKRKPKVEKAFVG